MLSILLFMLLQTSIPSFEVHHDVPYSQAKGYWSSSSIKENNFVAQAFQLCKTHKEKDLCLNMDIYIPNDSTDAHRPLVMLLHGGAFFANNKQSSPVGMLCEALAENGFVAASVNYRMGFKLNRESVSKTEGNALEDAKNALLFLTSHSREYHIDTTKLFIGGASSGAITTLRLAADPDIPDILGIIDMWGGVDSLSQLDSTDAAVIAFHGEDDTKVPYTEGYPLGGKRLMSYMYGSKPFIERRVTQGYKAELVSFAGYGHAPYRDKNYQLNSNYPVIRDRIVQFVKELSGTLPFKAE